MGEIKGYISIREASRRWGVSERRVSQYCTEGRIPRCIPLWKILGNSRGREKAV